MEQINLKSKYFVKRFKMLFFQSFNSYRAFVVVTTQRMQFEISITTTYHNS